MGQRTRDICGGVPRCKFFWTRVAISGDFGAVVQQLIEKGHVTYAYVGITTDDMTPSIAHAVGSSIDHGALIVDVRPGSPGAKAGLRGGEAPARGNHPARRRRWRR